MAWYGMARTVSLSVYNRDPHCGVESFCCQEVAGLVPKYKGVVDVYKERAESHALGLRNM